MPVVQPRSGGSVAFAAPVSSRSYSSYAYGGRDPVDFGQAVSDAKRYAQDIFGDIKAPPGYGDSQTAINLAQNRANQVISLLGPILSNARSKYEEWKNGQQDIEANRQRVADQIYGWDHRGGGGGGGIGYMGGTDSAAWDERNRNNGRDPYTQNQRPTGPHISVVNPHGSQPAKGKPWWDLPGAYEDAWGR